MGCTGTWAIASAAILSLSLAACSKPLSGQAASAPSNNTFVDADFEAERQWTPVFAGKQANSFIDKTSVTKNGPISTAFYRLEFNAPQTDETVPYDATVNRAEFDCARKKFRLDATAFFSDNKEARPIDSHEQKASDWEDAPPLSHAIFLIQAACDGVTNNMDHIGAESLEFKWTKLSEDRNQTTFIAKDNITDEEKNKLVWFMQDFKPINFPNGEKHGRGDPPNEFYSTKFKVEFNCSDQTQKEIYYATLAGPMGTGRIETKEPPADHWTPVQPGADHQGMDIACGANPSVPSASPSQPRDAIIYDPKAALNQQMIDQQTVAMRSCVDEKVGALIQGGVRSRSQLKTQLTFCARLLEGGMAFTVDQHKVHQLYEQTVDDAVDRFLAGHGQ